MPLGNGECFKPQPRGRETQSHRLLGISEGPCLENPSGPQVHPLPRVNRRVRLGRTGLAGLLLWATASAPEQRPALSVVCSLVTPVASQWAVRSGLGCLLRVLDFWQIERDKVEPGAPVVLMADTVRREAEPWPSGEAQVAQGQDSAWAHPCPQLVNKGLGLAAWPGPSRSVLQEAWTAHTGPGLGAGSGLGLSPGQQDARPVGRRQGPVCLAFRSHMGRRYLGFC